MIILPIMRIKNADENVDWIFLKMADQSYLIKIVSIMHNKCSRADIAASYRMLERVGILFHFVDDSDFRLI